MSGGTRHWCRSSASAAEPYPPPTPGGRRSHPAHSPEPPRTPVGRPGIVKANPGLEPDRAARPVSPRRGNTMKDTIAVETEIGGKPFRIEAGLLAQQAAGSCTVHPRRHHPVLGRDLHQQAPRGHRLLPAAGGVPREVLRRGPLPGRVLQARSAARREGDPHGPRSPTARSAPLFPEGYRNDVQINNMLLSADGENDSDILSIVAASAALTLSEIPFLGPDRRRARRPRRRRVRRQPDARGNATRATSTWSTSAPATCR